MSDSERTTTMPTCRGAAGSHWPFCSGSSAGSIWYAVSAWGALGDASHMSTFGWFALIAGSLITVAVGGGLMALVFYSSRNDYDRQARRRAPRSAGW